MTVLMGLSLVIVVGFVLVLVLITVVAKGWSIVVARLPDVVHRGHPGQRPPARAAA